MSAVEISEENGVKPGGSAADMRCMRERRSEIRMLCADLVEVNWKDAAGKRRKAQAVLEDISSSGACLQLESPVPLGVLVHWRSPKMEFSGLVRYCVYREIGYYLGVEFDDGSRWSKRVFKPQHLLDLEHLMNTAAQCRS
jgi:hypothetical protein